jgi:Ca2+-binding RTX toxin-like protein
MEQSCSQTKEEEKTMRKQIRRPLSIVVVSVLLVALAAGAALAAVVTCVPGATTCSGTIQDDYITGTGGVDRIYAGDGKDEVYASNGADSVYGGSGQDQLIGDDDIDSLANNDHIYGSSGDDVLSGESGSDRLDGGRQDDTIYAKAPKGEGKDTIKGDDGDDTIYAHDGIVDFIDCGDDFDEVDYDHGIDVVAANCESRVPHHSSVVADFSSFENPRGVWTYGHKVSDGSTLYPYTKMDGPYVLGLLRWSSGSSPEPMVAYNNTGQDLSYLTINHPPDVLNLHPGLAGQKSVVRWTAPFSGTVTIEGSFQGIDTHGTTTDVAVVHNSVTPLFRGNVNGYGARAPFVITKAVAAGDTIDFSVGYGSNRNYNNDSTGLSATILPTSWYIG